MKQKQNWPMCLQIKLYRKFHVCESAAADIHQQDCRGAETLESSAMNTLGHEEPRRVSQELEK